MCQFELFLFHEDLFQFDFEVVHKRLFQLASNKRCVARNRAKIYDLVKRYVASYSYFLATYTVVTVYGCAVFVFADNML